MYLFLDNTEPAELVFFVSKDGESFHEYRKSAKDGGSLPLALEEILVSEKMALADLRGIAVRVGVGRFTATRIAVVFANTLGYALRIPVSAVHDQDPKSAFKILLAAPVDKYIMAEYSAEPRLGNKN